MKHRTTGKVLKSQRKHRNVKNVPGVGNMNGHWVRIDSRTLKFVQS